MEKVRASLMWKPETAFFSSFFFFVASTVTGTVTVVTWKKQNKKPLKKKKKPLQTTVSNVGSIATYCDIELLERRRQPIIDGNHTPSLWMSECHFVCHSRGDDWVGRLSNYPSGATNYWPRQEKIRSTLKILMPARFWLQLSMQHTQRDGKDMWV